MRYLSLLSLLFLFQSEVQAQDSQYKVHCDCEHIAGVLEVSQGSEREQKEEALPQCLELTKELRDTDLGAIGLLCNDNNCTCIFSHSVYAFGRDRDSAIENAKSTCSAVSTSTSKEFAITSPDECKDEQ